MFTLVKYIDLIHNHQGHQMSQLFPCLLVLKLFQISQIFIFRDLNHDHLEGDQIGHIYIIQFPYFFALKSQMFAIYILFYYAVPFQDQ